MVDSRIQKILESIQNLVGEGSEKKLLKGTYTPTYTDYQRPSWTPLSYSFGGEGLSPYLLLNEVLPSWEGGGSELWARLPGGGVRVADGASNRAPLLPRHTMVDFRPTDELLFDPNLMVDFPPSSPYNKVREDH